MGTDLNGTSLRGSGMHKSPDNTGLKCHNGTCKKQHHYYQGYTFRLYAVGHAQHKRNSQLK